MRLTNAMTTNRLLLNLNRSATTVDRLWMQASTGKKIQSPAENPIIASRALRFRTNISETRQFQNNTNQGISWMEVSDSSLNNTTRILTRINDLLVQGASDTYPNINRQQIAHEISELYQQLNAEMNSTFAGRYVFSGFRTNHPPIIAKDDPDAHFEITKTINARDVARDVARAWIPPGSAALGSKPEPESERTNIIRLPYNNNNIDPATISIPGFTINTTPLGSAVNPYDVSLIGANQINFIPETGELVLGTDALNALDAGDLQLTYEVEGLFRGELNPIIYFDVVDMNTGVAFNQSDQEMQFEFGTNVRLTINVQSRLAYPWQFFSDIAALVEGVNRVQISTEEELRTHFSGPPHNLTNEALELAIEERLVQERALYRETSREKFSNMLALMERHSSTMTTEYTTLGSRLNRLNLIYERLDENLDTFTELMSQNENVDVVEVLMRLNAAESIYQAAMQIGARIAQLSLVNFI